MRPVSLALVLLLAGCASAPAPQAPSDATIGADSVAVQEEASPQLAAAFDDQGALKRRYPQAEQVGKYGAVTLWRLELTPARWRELESLGRYSPVYGEEQGQLRALPGGVIVRFDSSLSGPQIKDWLLTQGLAGRPMSGLGNTYLVESAAGPAALKLAQRIAEASGVVQVTPNWWQARSLRR